MTIASKHLDPIGLLAFARILHWKDKHEEALKIEKCANAAMKRVARKPLAEWEN